MTKAPDYTLVVGVDRKHLQQLMGTSDSPGTWATWRKNKPSLLDHEMIVFFDRDEVTEDQVRGVIDHPRLDTTPWPIISTRYEGTSGDKWSDPQRHKMLAGFVHVAALGVTTSYWLKLDTDTVAYGKDDWIDPDWFRDRPAIVAHRWTFTKPPDQMMKLDQWVDDNAERLPELTSRPPLNMVPEPGRSRIGHKRIISWCGFFNTNFTKRCSSWATQTGFTSRLPVPSQDGFMWYCAKRLGLPIKAVNMKHAGADFIHRSSKVGIQEACRKAMER